MKCQHAASGCNYPEGECVGLCRPTKYKPGVFLRDLTTGERFVVFSSNELITMYGEDSTGKRRGEIATSEVPLVFNVELK